MSTRIVIREETFEELHKLLFDRKDCEGAAFLLCGQHFSEKCTKLVAREVVRIPDEDFEFRGRVGLSISSPALVRATKKAKATGASLIFVHSHPDGSPDFSDKDDLEEIPLIDFFRSRLPGVVHGTMVTTQNSIRARFFVPQRIDVDLVLTIGSKFKLWSKNQSKPIPEFFDRQVIGFGEDIQRTLFDLHVGVVGLGGTGTPLAEQLYRLGVGHISLFDGDRLEATNLNRVYGSKLKDVGLPKAEVCRRWLDAIGLESEVQAISAFINIEKSAKLLADCDVIFGCTDKELPRAILNQLSLRYLIPVFDLGVLIDSLDGKLKGVLGRVTTLLPGEACLFCRERISVEGIRSEGLSPSDRIGQIAEGYAPELPTRAPAVIPFTSSTASTAIMEFLHRLTGYMGSGRVATEVLSFFDSNSIRTNRVRARSECICMDRNLWGLGDEEPFLGMLWPNHTK